VVVKLVIIKVSVVFPSPSPTPRSLRLGMLIQAPSSPF
jgi:hypothetical protein